ncbi:unnamed protein product [Pleuronectes platessa]|uniref:Uncharacterized protein n=1 Tax=Pleuronectes platessa TaxID=8262 RepID=A0A9N7UK03_PLEPL|nr:unnamed protein product [Pleuronectes platessa]
MGGGDGGGKEVQTIHPSKWNTSRVSGALCVTVLHVKFMILLPASSNARDAGSSLAGRSAYPWLPARHVLWSQEIKELQTPDLQQDAEAANEIEAESSFLAA